MGKIIGNLKIKKADHRDELRTFVVTTELRPILGVYNSVSDNGAILKQSGEGAVSISIGEIIYHMGQISDEEAGPVINRIMDGMDDSNVCAEWFINEAKYYLAVKKLMAMYQCNAYFAPCKELYHLSIPQRGNIVLEYAQSLLEQDGISCEDTETGMQKKSLQKVSYA
jgi:hypothetical protein